MQHDSCCLWHEFFKAATQNLQKIAVIHALPTSTTLASGGLPSWRELISSTPPIYEGDQCFTFADLLKSVDSLTSRLRSILDGSDDPHLVKPQSSSSKDTNPGEKEAGTANVYKPKILGLHMPPSVEYIISAFSILRCGGAFLPIDPSWPRDRVLSILSLEKVDLIITSGLSLSKGGFKESNPTDWLVDCISCSILCFSMEGSECSALSELVWSCENEKGRPFCYLMYTSGSTGKPKGVCGTELVGFIDHLQEFLSAMLTGCTLVIPPFNELKKYPSSLVDFLQLYSINRLTAVPSLMRAVLPVMQSRHSMQIQTSLELLILSGEVFPLSLWDALSSLLPRTSILNLYGSTEVADDCTYFDCKSLPLILDTEEVTSVPIGAPISNCDVALVCESETSDQGEIYVAGLCVSNGYYSESTITSLDSAKLHKNNICSCSVSNCGSQAYYRTGDFARRLQNGDLLFLGRIDRTVKVHGQRIALGEIKNTLRGHPDVVDAAVVSHEVPGELLLLDAFLLLKEKEKSGVFFESSIRKWMAGKVPLAMVPKCFVSVESFPMSSGGKVDYASLASSQFLNMRVQDEIGNGMTSDLLHVIRKVFCDALMVEEVSCDDDFFAMGGNSITAAHVSYDLGINMRMLYKFPTPSMLHVALLEEKESCCIEVRTDANSQLKRKQDTSESDMVYSVNHTAPNVPSKKSMKQLLENLSQKNDDHIVASKRFKEDLDEYDFPKCLSPSDGYSLASSISMWYSFSKCNKVMSNRVSGLTNTPQMNWLAEMSINEKGSMHELWKVDMESCVDASPLVVFKEQDVYLFIGSHAHKFVCINARSGPVLWEVKLKERIESSATIVVDFSQVVIGCYGGQIYFLDFLNGNICWTFQTCGEGFGSRDNFYSRRDRERCGSHDHNLYALDYRNRCCIYKHPCGGSIYGSPAIDEVHDLLYVGSTVGLVSALSIKALPFNTLWQHDLKAPVFGSLSVCSSNGNVICCLVDGNIVALDLIGSIVWRCRTGSPVFAGASISCMLPSQVLICSRNGRVYSFEMVDLYMYLFWKHASASHQLA